MTADHSLQPVPIEIRLDPTRRQLSVTFNDGGCFEMTAEYLRVHSPSAEVRGHGPGQGTLQLEKQDVAIKDISPVGNYAVRLIFDDGHDTGLYTWKLLHELGRNREENWRTYLARVAAAGSANTNTNNNTSDQPAPAYDGTVRRPRS